MAQSEDNILPVLDRRTPVLDRIRKRRNSEGTAESLGREVGRSILEEDETRLQQKRTDAVEAFRKGLADTLGVSSDDINEHASADIGELFAGMRREDVLTDEALRELGIENERLSEEIEESEGENEGEASESEPDF